MTKVTLIHKAMENITDFFNNNPEEAYLPFPDVWRAIGTTSTTFFLRVRQKEKFKRFLEYEGIVEVKAAGGLKYYTGFLKVERDDGFYAALNDFSSISAKDTTPDMQDMHTVSLFDSPVRAFFDANGELWLKGLDVAEAMPDDQAA